MIKKTYLLSLIPLLTSCFNTPSTTKTNYFKQYEDIVSKNPNGEYSFITLYDESDNRFSLTFGYGDHFHYEIKITEYDLTYNYIYPNEGKFSEDYESITFELDVKSESELFPDGNYTLKHEYKDNDDDFVLDVNGEEIKLTKEAKTPAKYINPNLVGDFIYEDYFSLSVTVSSLKTHREVSVSLKENDLTFVGENFVINDNNLPFKIKGDKDGSYIKLGDALLYYSLNVVNLKIGDTTYKLTRKQKEATSYFLNKDLEATFSNEYISITVSSLLGDKRRYLKLDELKEGGKKDMYVLFSVVDEGESLINEQGLTGNLVFTPNSVVKITHTLKENKDKIDLYKNNELLYENLLIS